MCRSMFCKKNNPKLRGEVFKWERFDFNCMIHRLNRDNTHLNRTNVSLLGALYQGF
jgi:hypothetical protein